MSFEKLYLKQNILGIEIKQLSNLTLPKQNFNRIQ